MEGSRRSTKAPEGSRRSTKIQEASRRFTKAHEGELSKNSPRRFWRRSWDQEALGRLCKSLGRSGVPPNFLSNEFLSTTRVASEAKISRFQENQAKLSNDQIKFSSIFSFQLYLASVRDGGKFDMLKQDDSVAALGQKRDHAK